MKEITKDTIENNIDAWLAHDDLMVYLNRDDSKLCFIRIAERSGMPNKNYLNNITRQAFAKMRNVWHQK